MAKAKQLPSGRWRTRVYDADGGSEKWKSFTADTATESEYLAMQYKLFKEREKKPENLSLGDAIDRYINGRTNVLSPSTITAYRCLRKNAYKDIEEKRLASIHNTDVQASINAYAKGHSAKTVANAFALLSSVMADYHPSLKLNINLPQKRRHVIDIPTTEEMQQIYKLTYGTPLYLPVLFASMLGMRRSEICALTWDDIDIEKKTVHIHSAVVLDEFHTLVKRGTKTYNSDRVLDLQQQIIDALPEEGEPIITLTPNQISDSFSRLVKKNGARYFSFHALRHYNASILLQLNVPDKYAMERMGHSTNNMLKNVYQHTFSTEQQAISSRVSEFFKDKVPANEEK